VNTAAVLAGTTEEQRVEREDPGEGLERHEEDGKRGDDHLPHDDRAADDGHGRAQLEIRPKRWGQ
jgi:hypothetical protein